MHLKNNKKILLIVFLISLFFSIYYLIGYENVEFEEKIVTKVIDGDTIIVQGGETIRLIGIDCDEKGRECFNPAKDYIDQLLLNQKVSLEGNEKDIYGRSLRYIYLNGENINVEMVENGYCVARFFEDEKYKSKIIKAEEYAINNQIGCKWQQ